MPSVSPWCFLLPLAVLVLTLPSECVSAEPTPSSPAATSNKSAPAVSNHPLAELAPRPQPVKPVPAADLDAAIGRGVDFLLKRQNANGSWGSEHATRPEEVYAPIPGSHSAFRAAVTSLCISALLEVGGDSPKVSEAIDRGETWLFEHLRSVRRASPECMYNNWTHAYALEALTHMLHRRPNDADRSRKIRELIEHQIGMLGRYECVDGGWAYYDFANHTQRPSGSTLSFVTAAAMVSLAGVREEGIAIPPKLTDRAIASIRRQRKPDFSYAYSDALRYVPMMPINRPGGSLGRSQACNLAMRLWGDRDTTDAVIKNWLDRLFARNLWLDMGRKRPIPHESWFQVAGYFFYYGHYYASRCIEQLPESDRGPYRDQLAHILLRVQEKDGSWWDFPLYDYHKQYGTAFALMSLGRCKDRSKATPHASH